MGVELKDAVVVQTAIVEKMGEKLILPTNMSVKSAIDTLMRFDKYEQESVVLTMATGVAPLDGACALEDVLAIKYGWTQQIPTPGFFGDNPPQMITVRTGHNSSRSVPWGRFTIPGVRGWISTGASKVNNRWVFTAHAEVRRGDAPIVEELFELVKQRTITHSIYKGKALRIRFQDDDGDEIELINPEFMDTSKINVNMAVYPDVVQAAVTTNLFTPIMRVQDCLNNGIPIKRGVLLGGTYGTGKTMAAHIASRLAEDAGITYIYAPRADELKQAIEFAKQYQSPACVIFCEDIDRVTAGDRSVAMDDILNTIDGIDSKNSHIIVVLTTNNLDSINPAMLRPGRLDAVIEVTPPDAKAVERLIRLYAGNSIAADADISKAGELLAGQIPAIVAEVVKRAKLAQVTHMQKGGIINVLSEQAIIEAAATMKGQMDLLARLTAPKDAKPTLETVMTEVVHGAMNGMREAVHDTHHKLKDASIARFPR